MNAIERLGPLTDADRVEGIEFFASAFSCSAKMADRIMNGRTLYSWIRYVPGTPRRWCVADALAAWDAIGQRYYAPIIKQRAERHAAHLAAIDAKEIKQRTAPRKRERKRPPEPVKAKPRVTEVLVIRRRPS